ncbi:MAG: hypothetical protein ACI9MS_000112, partial [Glaciecola sp.]
MKTHVASYFLFLPLFYFLDGVEIGDFSFITRPFSHNSEFKTSAAYRRLNGNCRQSQYIIDEFWKYSYLVI